MGGWLVGEGGGVKNLIKYFSGLNIYELVFVLGSIEKVFFLMLWDFIWIVFKFL